MSFRDISMLRKDQVWGVDPIELIDSFAETGPSDWIRLALSPFLSALLCDGPGSIVASKALLALVPHTMVSHS